MTDGKPSSHSHRLQDRIGIPHGHLTPIRYTGMAGGRSTWECRCTCGNVVIKSSGYLGALGERASCGCVDSVEHVEVACRGCNKPFRVPKFVSHRAAYCTNECRIAAMAAKMRASGHGDVELVCFVCGITFTVPYNNRFATYCSRECKAARASKKVELTCAHCGITFFKFPSTAANAGRLGRGHFCSWLCKVIGSTSVVTRVKLRGRCNRCGYSEEPEVLAIHHRDRDKTNNTRENLELICPTCHAVEHLRAKDGPFRNLTSGNHLKTAAVERLRQALLEFEKTTGRKSPFWDF